MKKIRSTVQALAFVSLAAGFAVGDTTQTAPSVYEINAGVTFSLRSSGTSSWLLSWTDNSGVFSNKPDPTIILTAGETYIFDNMTNIHLYAITDDTLPVIGTDGNYTRTTSNPFVIESHILAPAADFTSDPGPSFDNIVWTPTVADIGDYFYTCLITFHNGMTGKLVVVAPPPPACPADLTGDGVLNFFDVSAFLNAFTAGDPIADFTNDGNFNFFDVSAFLNAFTTGCP